MKVYIEFPINLWVYFLSETMIQFSLSLHWKEISTFRLLTCNSEKFRTLFVEWFYHMTMKLIFLSSLPTFSICFLIISLQRLQFEVHKIIRLYICEFNVDIHTFESLWPGCSFVIQPRPSNSLEFVQLMINGYLQLHNSFVFCGSYP